MTPALAALGDVDFTAACGADDLWSDPRAHVDALNADAFDRIVAEFSVRTRAPDSNPDGLILSGAAGAGKTHLLAALRRRVAAGGGWFVRIDVSTIADFWSGAALAFVDSLLRRMSGGQTQAAAILTAALKRISADPQALQAAASARPRLEGAGAVDVMLAMLAAIAPTEAQKHEGVLRALALLESRDAGISAAAGRWLAGQQGQEMRLRPIERLGDPPPPAEIVRGLLWIMSLGGPTLIAVDGLDSLVGEAGAPALLQTIAEGLLALHQAKRRALMLVSCLDTAGPTIRRTRLAERLRALQPLAPVASAMLAERLIAARLAPAYADAGFIPPYPTFPFTRDAIASAVGFPPRAILTRCGAHLRACLAQDEVFECATLAQATAPGETVLARRDAEAFDDAFAHALARADPPDFQDEAAVAALLVAACQLYLRQIEAPEGVVGEAIAPIPVSGLHARLVFLLHDENDRQRRFDFCVLAQDEAAAFQARLKAAMTASGLAPGLEGRKLFVLRGGPPPAAAKTEALAFLDAGGRFVAAAAQDLAIFSALRQLAEKRADGFDAWLRRRKPLFEAKLFQASGLTAPDFLAARAAAPDEVAAPTPAPAPTPAAQDLPDRDAIFIGRVAEPGEAATPLSLTVDRLLDHVAIVAASAAGATALLAHIVEQAAQLGVSALLIDVNGDLTRFGEPWPDAAASFERVETRVWTPGLAYGRPLALPLLPDFAALKQGGDADSLEDRERAVDMAVAALEPYLLGGGAKAIKLRGALADGLRAFARAGGGGLDDLVGLLGDFPKSASRIAEAPKLAREIAEQLVAAMAANPQLAQEIAPFDPALLFEGDNSKTRVSVIALAGLTGEARAAFVHRLQMTLLPWMKRHPSPTPRLYALDEAQTWLADAAAKRSLLALLKHGRKHGLGVVLAAGEPRAVDPAALSQCATRLRAADGEPAAGAFHFTSEGAKPILIHTPLRSAQRPPPTAEEIAAIARRG